MRWLLVLVIIGAALLFFLNNGESAKKPSPPPAPPAEAPAPPAPAGQAPEPPPQAAPPQPAPAMDANALYSRMQSVAQQVGVELRGLQAQPGNIWVSVAWKGGNATLGGDFLEACMRQNLISNFNVNNAKLGMEMDPSGIQYNTAQYQVYLP